MVNPFCATADSGGGEWVLTARRCDGLLVRQLEMIVAGPDDQELLESFCRNKQAIKYIPWDLI